MRELQQIVPTPVTHDRHGNAVEIGSVVRSFDFAELHDDGTEYRYDLHGERACYVEGVCEGVVHWRDGQRYAIRVTGRVVRGKPLCADDLPEYIYAPLNGAATWLGRICMGVDVVTAVAEVAS